MNNGPRDAGSVERTDKASAPIWLRIARLLRRAVALMPMVLVLPTSAQPIVPGTVAERVSTGGFALVQPTGLVVTASNDIYIGRNLFSGTSDVLRIAPTGEVTQVAAFGNFIGGMTLDAHGQVVGTLQNASIFKLTDVGYDIIAMQVGSVPQHLAALGSDLYVASFAGSSVIKVDAVGMVNPRFASVREPLGITTDGVTLFVGESNSDRTTAVVLLDNRGVRVDVLPSIPGRIVDLEFDSRSGNLFAAIQSEGGTYSRIERFRDGMNIPYAWNFDDFPRDIAVAPNGDLLVADASSLYRIPAIPEPTIALLLAMGLGCVIALKRHHLAR